MEATFHFNITEVVWRGACGSNSHCKRHRTKWRITLLSEWVQNTQAKSSILQSWFLFISINLLMLSNIWWVSCTFHTGHFAALHQPHPRPHVMSRHKYTQRHWSVLLHSERSETWNWNTRAHALNPGHKDTVRCCRNVFLNVTHPQTTQKL